MKHFSYFLSFALLIITSSSAFSQIISNFPYVEDFENSNGGWTPGGSWAYGSPAKSTINSAASGTKAWVVGGLSGQYGPNENSSVESPEFDFSNLLQPIIQVNIWWESENSWDGAVLQSSVNGGTSWTNVGSFGDPNNWFNDNTINGNPGGQQQGWTGANGAGSNGWVLAKHGMNSLIGQPSVKLRFAFGSDASVFDDGFAFDDVLIFDQKANDLAILEMVSPVQDCGLGTEDVTVRFRNFGFQSQSGFGITYQLNDQTPVTETYANSVNQDQTVTYTFNQSINVSSNDNYKISVWLDLATDENRVNDSILNRGLKTVLPIPPVSFGNFNGSNLAAALPGWREATGTLPNGEISDWEQSNVSQSIFFGDTTARINLSGNTQRDWIISPIFKVTQSSILYFRTAITEKDTTSLGTFGSDDKVEVLISTDCGSTWPVELTLDASSGLTNSLQQFGIRLDPYVNQEIIVAFKATDGPTSDPEDIDVHISQFEARYIYPNDAGLVYFRTNNGTQTIPANSGTNIYLRLKNYGSNTISNIPILAKVGAVNYQFIRYQNLGANQEVEVNLGGYYASMQGPPQVPVFAFTMYPNDTVNSNDTIDSYLNVTGAIGVGLDDSEHEFINIYPNPSSDGVFQLHASNLFEARIEIFNLEGVLVKSIELKNTVTPIDISDLAKGVYVLKYKEGEFSSAKKLIYR